MNRPVPDPLLKDIAPCWYEAIQKGKDQPFGMRIDIPSSCIVGEAWNGSRYLYDNFYCRECHKFALGLLDYTTDTKSHVATRTKYFARHMLEKHPEIVKELRKFKQIEEEYST